MRAFITIIEANREAYEKASDKWAARQEFDEIFRAFEALLDACRAALPLLDE